MSDHLPQSSAEVQNEWSYIHTSCIQLCYVQTDKFTLLQNNTCFVRVSELPYNLGLAFKCLCRFVFLEKIISFVFLFLTCFIFFIYCILSFFFLAPTFLSCLSFSSFLLSFLSHFFCCLLYVEEVKVCAYVTK